MRCGTWLTGLGVLAIAGLSVAQVSCDAKSTAMRLFASKGLNLLDPPRDYVKPGGLVFLAKGSHPEYDDPADPIRAESGNLTNFRADIMQEVTNKTTKFAAALTLAKTILPSSFSANAQSDQNVSLKEIATTGLRLPTDKIDEYLKKTNTKRAATEGLKGNLRVFVVQEIYEAKSLDLSADKTKGFALKYDNGDPVTNCAPAGADGAKKDITATNKNTEDKTTGGAGAKAEQKGTDAPAAKVAKKDATATEGAGSPARGIADSTAKLQAGVAMCMANSYTLKMNAAEPIPFAVRLAELELSDTGVRRKRGARVITTTLSGGRKADIAADVVSDAFPLLDEMVHRSVKK